MHPILGKDQNVDSFEAPEINPYTGMKYTDQYKEILRKRQQLPVYQYKNEILESIKFNSVVIIEGQTGSGKTTQIPQFILDSGICPPNQKIVCTQPRRVAASSVAMRVADEMDVNCGDVVGYSVRFDSNYNSNTRLLYMTDGLLLREFVEDPMISKYGVVIIDEAHERTINTDIILGLLKQLNEIRKDLKIIVMSATLDADKFVKFFIARDILPPHIKVPGKLYNVTLHYTPGQSSNYRPEIISRVMTICTSDRQGDILIFLTGEDEIESLCSILRDKISATRRQNRLVQAEVFPMYAQLPYNEQKKVLEPLPNGVRKIVVATNIAETSITIEGIVFVIDSGFIKESHYSPKSRKKSLIKVRVSKASADQRKGRAGRTREGECYRIYSEDDYNNMLDQTLPEIQRSDLSELVLLMIAAHVTDIVHFPFLDFPHFKLLVGALEELYHLGVFVENFTANMIGLADQLTPHGAVMSRIPVSPKYSRSLIAAAQYGCSDEVSTIVAILSEPGNVFFNPRVKKKEADEAHMKFYDKTGDHMTYLKIMQQFEEIPRAGRKSWANANFINARPLEAALRSKRQLVAQLKREGYWGTSENTNDKRPLFTRIAISFLAGGFMQVARFEENGKYQVLINRTQADIVKYGAIKILQPEDNKWILYDEYVNTGEDDAFRTVSVIQPSWCIEAAPTYFVPSNFPEGPVRTELEQGLKQFNLFKFGGA